MGSFVKAVGPWTSYPSLPTLLMYPFNQSCVSVQSMLMHVYYVQDTVLGAGYTRANKKGRGASASKLLTYLFSFLTHSKTPLLCV